MTSLLLNRPSFSRLTNSSVAHRRAEANSPQTIYRTFSEDALDRLRLTAAAERYEGADWTKFRQIG